MKKMSTIILAIAIAITFMPMPGGEAHAAKTKKPAKVTGVKVVAKTTSSVTLKWKKAKRTKKYQVFMKKGSKFKKIKTTKNIKVVVKKLKAGTVYKFKVRGINGKKKGKYSKIIGVKTNKKSKGGKISSGGDSSSAPANVPQIAKNLNVAPGGMVEKNELGITIKEKGYAYDPETNLNHFKFCIRLSDKTKNLTMNAVNATPKKVVDFFGKFYNIGAVPVRQIKTYSFEETKDKNYYLDVYTDPFVSDIYLCATDKSGKMVYGKKSGWDYGENKHNSSSAMFLWAEPKNDVFKKMYDNARKKILAKVTKPENTFMQNFAKYEHYVSNIVHWPQERYDITKYGKWIPGYVTFNYGIDIRDDSNLNDHNRHDESTKCYKASSNFQYLTMLGLTEHTCQVSHDTLVDDMAKDIDPKVEIHYNLRTVTSYSNHVDIGLKWSDGSGAAAYNIMAAGDSFELTPDEWDFKLKNSPDCRENFKAQVPNWEVWDIL